MWTIHHNNSLTYLYDEMKYFLLEMARIFKVTQYDRKQMFQISPKQGKEKFKGDHVLAHKQQECMGM